MEELLVSFDGLSFNLPPEITKRGWNRGNTWYHTDQSFTNADFSCVQSFITGMDINEYDATFSFFEGSHRFHSKFKDQFKITDKSNWYKLNKDQETFYFDLGCSIKKIICSKGSLVLWDSRTIHCGIEAESRRKVPNVRAIIYLSYMRRIDSDKKNLEKKPKAFNELRTTTHYAHKVKLFGKSPRTYGNPIPTITQINKPVLNELGKKLAGF
jgi:ectoine hydroxylase-related dioxygenase (phytanoyl-CoA dioxygenase family)